MPNLRRQIALRRWARSMSWTALVWALFASSALRAQTPDPAPLENANVADVRLVGNETVEMHRITPHIQTRKDRPFSLETVAEDVRRLTKTRMFLNVDTTYQRTVDGGVIVIFRVVESPRLQYVKYVGTTFREAGLNKETGLKAGDPLDTYQVVEARTKIEEYYHKKGYAKVRVSIIEGDKPDDRGAVFLIHEGRRQRVWRTEFVGNTIASDSRLRTQIRSKAPFAYLFGGELSREKLEADLERLTAYYRSLGFFRARIGREIEYNDAENWVTVTFVVDEGIRYSVRDIAFIGNKKVDTTELKDLTKLRSGDYFDQSVMNSDVTSITDRYGGNGYIYATVQPDPRFLEEPGQLDLVYQIQEGDRYRIGKVNVKIDGDNPRTRRHTVLNYISLKPGDIADTRKLRSDENRLQRSGLFMNNPAQGQVPKIVFREPNLAELERQFAAEEQGVRGQSPDSGVAYIDGEPVKTIDVSVDGQWVVPDDEPQTVRGQSPGYYSELTAGAPSVAGQVPTGRTGPDAFAGGTAQPYRDPQTGQWITPQYVPPAAQSYPPGTTYPAPTTAYQPTSQPASSTIGPSLTTPYNAYQPPVATYPDGTAAPTAGPVFAPPGTVAPGALPPPNGYNTPGELVPNGVAEGLFNSEPTRTVDIDTLLTETQTGRIMLGVGVSSAAGVIGSVVIEEQNFDWRRFPRSFSELIDGRGFRGGGQRFRIEAVPGSQVSRYMFTFQQPFLLDSPVSFSLSAFYYQRYFTDWYEKRGGGNIGLGYQFPNMPNLTVGGTLRMEAVNVYNPRIPTPPQVLAVLGDTSLYTARFNITHDTRDSTFLPTQGHYLEMAYEQGFGEFDYPRGTIDARQHFLIRERPDRSGRHVATIASTLGFSGSQTPVYENFFAGYPNFRGFRFRGASPIVDGTHVGGTFEWINTVEYMMPVTADDMVRAVAFCDFGTVEQSVKIDPDTFRVSPGFGLRLTIPMMGPAPIALDFSVPVAHAPGDQIQNFQFFVGAAR